MIILGIDKFSMLWGSYFFVDLLGFNSGILSEVSLLSRRRDQFTCRFGIQFRDRLKSHNAFPFSLQKTKIIISVYGI